MLKRHPRTLECGYICPTSQIPKDWMVNLRLVIGNVLRKALQFLITSEELFPCPSRWSRRRTFLFRKTIVAPVRAGPLHFKKPHDGLIEDAIFLALPASLKCEKGGDGQPRRD
jgi:hypothetical protein